MVPAGVIDNLQFCVFHRYESLENHRVVIWRPPFDLHTQFWPETINCLWCLWPDQASVHTRGCRHSHAHTSDSRSICEYLFSHSVMHYFIMPLFVRCMDDDIIGYILYSLKCLLEKCLFCDAYLQKLLFRNLPWMTVHSKGVKSTLLSVHMVPL